MEDNNNNLNQNIHRPATIATETNPVNDKYHGVTEFNICSLNIQGFLSIFTGSLIYEHYTREKKNLKNQV